jgi:hypothetical protein
MIWNLFQCLSNELSDPVQHSFLIYDEEKYYFKGIWAISFELKNRVFCHLSQLDLASWEKSILALEGCLHIINSQQRKIRDRPLFEEIFLVSCKQFLLSIFS